MRLQILITALYVAAVSAEPAIVSRNTDALTSPFLDRRSDTVLTLDGRLISRQDVRITNPLNMVHYN
ncbi:hypothetical protein HWV62_29577 [Athelia sp. TMB]|nr:hypothetical protein HWV62_29577 [Athelia sp. TMB]